MEKQTEQKPKVKLSREQQEEDRQNRDKRSQAQIEEANIDWSRRHVDSSIMMRWRAAIAVIPANSSKGNSVGTRIYPNGVQEKFKVGLNRAWTAED